MSEVDILDAISKKMAGMSNDRTRFSQFPKKNNIPVQRKYRTSGPIFSVNEVQNLQNLLNSSPDNFEVEASFGLFKNGKFFQPGLKSQ